MISRKEANAKYDYLIKKGAEEGVLDKVLSELGRSDLFFLLTRLLTTKYLPVEKTIDRDWLYERCREVQKNPDGHLDLWAREHYKSTIITFGLSVQDILNNPEITIGIFSYTVSTAKKFLKQIKNEFETNELLKQLYPEILWKRPEYEAPLWNEDGIIVRRKMNPKEATVEAHGLEKSPTGRHFMLMVYDDVVEKDNVNTPEMINKTTISWELSLSLASEGGKVRYIGTRYHYDDTYATILDRGLVRPRIYPATDNGKPDGVPVLFSDEYWQSKKQQSSPYILSCQFLLNPKADGAIGFKEEWLRFFPAKHFKNMNIYIIVDPANTKKKRSDYTAMMVVAMGTDENFYILDMVRDRLNLTEKAHTLMSLVRQYRPNLVGYEEYGMQADIRYIKELQDEENFHFEIVPLGGKVSKEDRIAELIPLFENKRIYLPDKCIKTNYEMTTQDLTQVFIKEEYLAFPYAGHDDMLDALSRIVDKKMSIRPPGNFWGREDEDVLYSDNDFDPWNY